MIEVMVVVAIMAILASIAAPSFKSAIQSSQMTSGVNSFLADMRFARSEAIRRGGGVVLCRSNSPEATGALCDGTTGATNGWQTGWIIFHDLNNDGGKDAGETILRAQAPIATMDKILGTTPTYTFRFNATGRLPGTAETIKFGDTAFTSSTQRTLCVSFGGRARVAGNGSATCS